MGHVIQLNSNDTLSPLKAIWQEGGEIMKTEQIKVSYRDKEANKNVALGTVDAPRFDSLEEASAFFESEEGEGKGVGAVLDYIHTAYDIELQRRYRDAHRPDKPKAASNVSIFKTLSQAQQEELLKSFGLLTDEVKA